LIPKIRYEISGGAGHYNYAPSAIQDKYGIRYMFMCQNKDPFKIVDYIYLFKGIPTENGYVWQPGTMLVAPSETGWDNCHICDPDVREFALTYKGEKYSYIMTYLGVDQWDCKHNQIGLAFSKCIEGPWVKYDKNPLIAYEDRTKWGVGQSISIVLDTTTLQIFYHKTGTICARNIKLNNLDSIQIGEEKVLPFTNPGANIAFSRNNIYVTTEKWINTPFTDIPTWVGDYIRFEYKPLSKGLFSEKNEWIQLSQFGEKESGFPRNHNPGFLTDTRGYLLSDDEAIVYFTVSVTGSDWLWSYDMYSATYDLKDHVTK